jgi:DNA-binding MarR family transcriptional regulator
MTIDLESANLTLRLWFMIYRTHNMLKMCEDRVYREYKLTTEQYVVLVTIKYLDGPVRPTDIARWLRHSPNSISMIIERMVKAGLLRRIRDRKDRREVRLIITSKGEEALKPALRAGLGFIWETLLPLSDEDKQTFSKLLLTVQYQAHKYLNPGDDIEELRRNEAERHKHFMERQIQAYGPQLFEAKRKGGKKGKAI